jgi:hypothetical protein
VTTPCAVRILTPYALHCHVLACDDDRCRTYGAQMLRSWAVLREVGFRIDLTRGGRFGGLPTAPTKTEVAR